MENQSSTDYLYVEPARIPRKQWGTIHVTQNEIDKGTVQDSHSCMIAEAVKNCVPRAKNVSVDLATIRFTDKETGERYVYQTPAGVQGALVNFDQGSKPEPFKFKLATLFQIRPKPTITRNPATIGFQKPHGNNRETAPIKIGGEAPPKSMLAGGRGGITRRFGLRTLPSGTPGAKLLPSEEGNKPETS